MIETLWIEGLIADRVMEIAWDDCGSSYANFTGDVIVGNVCTVVVDDSGNLLDLEE